MARPFRLFTNPTSAPRARSTPANPEAVAPEIADFLAALSAGHFANSVPAPTTALGRALGEVQAKLAARARGEADAVVATSQNATELNILLIRLLAPLRETSANAQAMTTAVEEMVASIREIDRASRHTAESTEDAGRATIEALNEGMATASARLDNISQLMTTNAGILSQQMSAMQECSQHVLGVAEMATRNLAAMEAVAQAADGLEAAISQQMGIIAAAEFDGKVIRLAKADHVIWKRRLIAMASGRARLKVAELADHHGCRLGKWIESEASAPYRDHPAFAQLDAPHRRVHEYGKRAAALFEAGKTDEALSEIAAVEAASVEVLRCLDALQRG